MRVSTQRVTFKERVLAVVTPHQGETVLSMTAQPISRLPTPLLQPSRPFSRYSNLSESYVYPHTDIHPLTLLDGDKPRFDARAKPPPPPQQQSIFQPNLTPAALPPSLYAPQWQYGADLCLPRVSTPSAVHVDPTYNAPLSAALAAASLDRFPLRALSANTLHRSRQAVEEDEEDGRRRKDEQQRVRQARQAARRRVAGEECRRRDEAERRIQQLPLHVRQLVYQKWEETPPVDDTLLHTTQAAAVSDEAENGTAAVHLPAATTAANTQRTMHIHELDDCAPCKQTASARRSDDTVATIRHGVNGSWGAQSALSRDEQRVFQLRVQQLAKHKERLELHRLVAWRKEDAQRRKEQKAQSRQHQQEAAAKQLESQQHNDTARTAQPPPPAPRPARQPSRRQAASAPPSPRSSSRSGALSWLYDELERRLRALGDVSLAPLCGCSQGGGRGGVGRGVLHGVAGCEWSGRDEAYAMKLLERVEELERAEGERRLSHIP